MKESKNSIIYFKLPELQWHVSLVKWSGGDDSESLNSETFNSSALGNIPNLSVLYTQFHFNH